MSPCRRPCGRRGPDEHRVPARVECGRGIASTGAANPCAHAASRRPALRSGRAPADPRDTATAHVGLDRAGCSRPSLPPGHASSGRAIVWLPTPAGTFRRFEVQDSPVMMPRLAAAHPEIRTYVGRGLAGNAAGYTDESVRLAVTLLGVTASVHGPSGCVVRRSAVPPRWERVHELLRPSPRRHSRSVRRARARREAERPFAPRRREPVLVIGDTLRTYRLAALTDPSFADYWVPANVLSGLVINLNRRRADLQRRARRAPPPRRQRTQGTAEHAGRGVRAQRTVRHRGLLHPEGTRVLRRRARSSATGSCSVSSSAPRTTTPVTSR